MDFRYKGNCWGNKRGMKMFGEVGVCERRRTITGSTIGLKLISSTNQSGTFLFPFSSWPLSLVANTLLTSSTSFSISSSSSPPFSLIKCTTSFSNSSLLSLSLVLSCSLTTHLPRIPLNTTSVMAPRLPNPFPSLLISSTHKSCAFSAFLTASSYSSSAICAWAIKWKALKLSGWRARARRAASMADWWDCSFRSASE